MTALRVLLMGSYLPPRGGAEVHLADCERLLRAAGHEVEVYAPPPAMGRVAALRERVHSPVVAQWLRDRIATARPHVVHVHNFLRRLSTAPFRIAAAAGVPTVLTVHDYQLACPRTWSLREDGTACMRTSLPVCVFGGCRGGEAGLGGRAVYALNALRVRAAARTVAHHATRILAPSQRLALRVATVLGREVAHVPYPFPDAVPFVPPASARLLFLGRVAKEKGVLELVHAVAVARQSGAPIELTIAGDGPLLGAVRERVAAARLESAVQCTGWIDAAAVPSLLASHAALVLPSVWIENSPLSVHEALAAGRAVLGSTRGGIPELVDDGREGLLFDPLDAAAFVAALRRWAELDGVARTAMAAAAHTRAARSGDPARFVHRLLAEYGAAMAAAAEGGRR